MHINVAPTNILTVVLVFFVLILILMFECIMNPDGKINNKKSINRLAQVAVAYAQAGEQESLTYHNGCHSLVTP